MLSAVFNHTIFAPFDAESSTTPVPPAGGTQRFSSTHSGTFNHSLSSSRLGTSNSNPTASHTHHGRLNPSDAPPSSSSTNDPPTPVPTFHYLTNLRFPPGTPPNLVQDYEEACRDLFTTLGKRAGGTRFHGPGHGQGGGGESDFSDESSGATLAVGLGEGLAELARLLESAAIVGPLIAVLSLLSTLVFLFPVFALYFLNDAQMTRRRAPSKLLPLLAKIVKRFGRPSPAVRIAEKGSRLGKAKERSRRVRGVVLRTSVVPAKDEDERVDLDPAKREGLLFVVVEVLEGLAWRMPERVEEKLVLLPFAPLSSC